MIRRSIVDLSADQKTGAAENVATVTRKGQIRRSVASKRRPSALRMRSSFSTSGSTEIRTVSDEAFTLQKAEKDAAVSEVPGCRLVLKEFRKRNCAVYEPVLTLRTVSVIRPLFFRCLNYIDSHMDEFKPADGKDSTTDPGLFTSHLRNLATESLDHLRRLEETDDALMHLVHEVELESSELFRHQLKWCSAHSTPVKQGSSTESRPLYYMPPWDTAMVNRLENLEEKKQKIAELEKEGNEMCESLDKLICDNLSSVMSMIEAMTASSKFTEVLPSSSLRPHPSLMRYRSNSSSAHAPTCLPTQIEISPSDPTSGESFSTVKTVVDETRAPESSLLMTTASTLLDSTVTSHSYLEELPSAPPPFNANVTSSSVPDSISISQRASDGSSILSSANDQMVANEDNKIL